MEWRGDRDRDRDGRGRLGRTMAEGSARDAARDQVSETGSTQRGSSLASLSTSCYSARGFVADRRSNTMKCLDSWGSNFRAEQHAGKHLEYVAFPIGNHRHPCRQRHQACTRLHAVNPALALFVAKSPVPRESFPAATALNDLRINQSKHCAMLGFNRNRRMANKAVARAIITKAGRILDRQNVQAIDARGRVKRSLFDNLLDRHLLIPEKPPNTDLASSIPAHAAHRDPSRPKLDKTIMQEAPGLIQTTIPKMRHTTIHISNSRSSANSRNGESEIAENEKTQSSRKQNEMCAYGSLGTW